MIRVALALCVVGVFAVASSASPPDLTGSQWSGSWESETKGHKGPLHARFTLVDAETYHVRYHGRFLKIVPFCLSSDMHVAGYTDGAVILTAKKNIGPFGTFETTATVTCTSFDANYTATNKSGKFIDSGKFIMTRKR